MAKTTPTTVKAVWTKLPMKKLFCFSCQQDKWHNPKAYKEGTNYRCTGCGKAQ